VSSDPFRIVSEGALAAGIRRIEAITSAEAERMINAKLAKLDAISALLKNPADVVSAVEKLVEQNMRSARNWRRRPRRK
jgi:alanyl-tRNA synthetase